MAMAGDTAARTDQPQTVSEQLDDFPRYIAEMYRTGIEQLDHMEQDAYHELDLLMGKVDIPAFRSDDELLDDDAVTEQVENLAQCRDERLHDRHEWTHPDGRQVWCVGRHGENELTMPLVREKKQLDEVPGFPSAKIYVLDEDQVYEYAYKSDTEMEWRPVGGGTSDENESDTFPVQEQ